MAKSPPAWANRIRASLLRPVLALLAPINITISTTPVVVENTPSATGDENDHEAEPVTPTGRARGPPRPPRRRGDAAGGPEPTSTPSAERTTTHH
jgi:hypothetical protein